MKKVRSFVLIMGLLWTNAALANDRICKELDAFAAAQWSDPGNPLPRHWVEFHWGIDPDPNTIWSWGYRHSEDISAKKFCEWLMNNTSREFPSLLQMRVMDCMGYRFPRDAVNGWHMRDGEVTHMRKDGSWLRLKFVTQELKPSGTAVRISFDSVDRKLEPDELDPFEPLGPGNTE